MASYRSRRMVWKPFPVEFFKFVLGDAARIEAQVDKISDKMDRMIK